MELFNLMLDGPFYSCHKYVAWFVYKFWCFFDNLIRWHGMQWAIMWLNCVYFFQSHWDCIDYEVPKCEHTKVTLCSPIHLDRKNIVDYGIDLKTVTECCIVYKRNTWVWFLLNHHLQCWLLCITEMKRCSH
jgi:hypothetical protein